MAERSLVEILLRSRGAKEVYESSKLASAGIKDIGQAAVMTNRRTELLHKGLLGLGAAGAGVGFLLYEGAKKSVEAYGEYEGALAQVDRQLKNTHESAGTTSAAIERQAKSLSALSGVSDKFAILSGESLLLTFTRVRNEAGKGNKIFDRTTKAAVDMTAAFRAAGKSMTEQQAFTILGRALQDPIKGATLLRRAQIQLTAAQVKQVTTLETLGDHLGAQKLILDAVNSRFKDAAKTAGETLPGALGKWHVASMNLEEGLGHGLAPIVSGLADDMTRLEKGADPAFTKLGDHLNDIWGNKHLSLGDKLDESISTARVDLHPLADKIEQGLKDAQLDKKLEGAIQWAAPRMADGFAHAAPKAASAFLNAFMDADAWGKLLVGGVIAKKLGAFGLAGKLLGKKAGGVGGIAGELVGRGSSPLRPLFVVDISSTTGKGWLSTAEKDVEKAAPGFAARWGSRFLKYGKFAPPVTAVVTTADALINADSTGGGRRADGTYQDEIPLNQRHRVAIHQRRPSHGPAGGDPRGVFSSGPVRHQTMRLVVPVTVLTHDNKVLAEGVAEHPDILAGADHRGRLTAKARG